MGQTSGLPHDGATIEHSCFWGIARRSCDGGLLCAVIIRMRGCLGYWVGDQYVGSTCGLGLVQSLGLAEFQADSGTSGLSTNRLFRNSVLVD